ncbi:Transcriptional regulator, LysR family [hydrothermal vent metagenome]|uniref:Transcriptional regulator, LysR family n=1 Tax=hydrothermal vent metagenome TaxID=652676 RepID=A0A3B0TS89_9ZZZZ
MTSYEIMRNGNDVLRQRRFLPSTSLLIAFEAAARTASFTKAADELNLTQSAVSRQIKTLENQLGIDLFTRERQRVKLTIAGARYALEVREALNKIANASMMLQINPGGGTLNLAILPTFGSRWLAPRLLKFLKNSPGVTVNFSTRLKPFDFSVEQFDAAIHFGQPVWPGAQMAFLMNETILPACSPKFLAEHRLSSPQQLALVQLIHLSSRPDAWERWFRLHNVSSVKNSGMVFDQFATAAQAAHHGIGVALLPRFLIKRELAEGELVPALDLPLESQDAYYLVWPGRRADHPPLVAFRKWIIRESKE